MATAEHAHALDVTVPQKVSYCIPMWLRDEQIRVNVKSVPHRFVPATEIRAEPIAVVCYGPSLNETWEQVHGFAHVMTCSGAHKFLIERGIVPTWHLDVDPREHKIALIGEPHPDVEYLLAATCHPKYFAKLLEGGYHVKLWHIFDGSDDGLRAVPPGEWAVTGGCSVGLRALALARLLGFRDLHVFGMDGNEGKSGKHAAAHPNQPPLSRPAVYNGVTYQTTPAILEAARQTFHELDQLKDVTATFYGEGLVQAMAKAYVPKRPKDAAFIAFNKPELISAEYRALNAQLHRDNLAYGVGGGRHAKTILKLADTLKTHAILDYGCGKGYLAKELPFPIWEYDPSVDGKQDSPRPADLVICGDVLEHIEPDKLPFVLDDLRRCVLKMGYFVIHTGPAQKTFPDGRNTHLIQQPEAWWRDQLGAYFAVANVQTSGPELHVLVTPKPKAQSVRPLLALGNLSVRRAPYVIGVAANVFEAGHYRDLVATFPPVNLFRHFGGGDVKRSLSERNHPEAYHQYLAMTPVWANFHDYIKAPSFIQKIKKLLKAQDVYVNWPEKVSARFEFSALPAAGGYLRAHTDLPSKLVTLVLSMRGEADAWDDAWGGGTDVLVPREDGLKDYEATLDRFTVAHTYPYRSNQCVLFVKSQESWHSVGPFTGPAGEHWRKTITVNLEAAS